DRGDEAKNDSLHDQPSSRLARVSSHISGGDGDGAPRKDQRVATYLELPADAQAELRISAVSRRRNDAGRHVRDVRVGRSEVRVVEEVEDLAAQLHPRVAH